jgi:hypothetical protein
MRSSDSYFLLSSFFTQVTCLAQQYNFSLVFVRGSAPPHPPPASPTNRLGDPPVLLIGTGGYFLGGKTAGGGC